MEMTAGYITLDDDIYPIIGMTLSDGEIHLHVRVNGPLKYTAPRLVVCGADGRMICTLDHFHSFDYPYARDMSIPIHLKDVYLEL